MLEKIGLPPKPSLRGNSWVVDASHCQGCSSQFTFINRKHHCRRCGGIFCGSCTQQRMSLRGQGDSPVRICDPCKKLEEAARFEMRHRSKGRASKGSSGLASKKEEDILNEILGSADKQFSTEKIVGGSSSKIQEAVTQVEGGSSEQNLSNDQPSLSWTEAELDSPEKLRDQALGEKKKYKVLKSEGKSEEALRAYKRGKELERQAAALEISLRKNRKRTLSSGNMDDNWEIRDHVGATPEKVKLPKEKMKGKDDLSDELKELGWSELDIRDSEKRSANLTLEGELSSLLREVSTKPNKGKPVASPDKSQVIAHKKKALEMKRAGNLAQAKEELKKAKILERKIEEEELLVGADDSDDELSLLIRSMDADEGDDVLSSYKSDLGFNVDNFHLPNDFGLDGNLEVTNEDMEDPEMASALKSLGWADEAAYPEDLHGISSSDRESSLKEIQSLKREAVNQKRAGNTAEAMALLKKAKQLEMQLETFDTQNPFGSNGENIKQDTHMSTKLASKSKVTIQKELIALKKKILLLKREGRLDESEEELKKAKVLEGQLEDLDKSSDVQSSTGNSWPSHDMGMGDEDEKEVMDHGTDQVMDQDMHDPTYLSLLKNLGWEDEDEDNGKVNLATLEESYKATPVVSQENTVGLQNLSGASIPQLIASERRGTSRKSKSQIQRELLALKRRALALRREGQTEAADELLNDARSLEEQLQEYEEPTRKEVSSANDESNVLLDAVLITKSSLQVDLSENKLEDVGNANMVTLEKPEEKVPLEKPEEKVPLEKPEEKMSRDNENMYLHEMDPSQGADSVPNFSSLQQEIQAHKRKAIALKREGKLAEAKEELKMAKLLEKRADYSSQSTTNSDATISKRADNSSQGTANSSDATISNAPSIERNEPSPSSTSKPLSSRERFKLQQESLGHKRQALKLRREGKTAEAEAEFELAKSLESQLQESDSPDNSTSSKSADVDEASVEDFLDPQLLSALQSIGLQGAGTKSQSTERPEPAKTSQGNTSSGLQGARTKSQSIERPKSAKTTQGKTGNAEVEREQLVEQIKAEKVKAVSLKRAGKQTEALDALRRAKLYEKKLESFTPN